MLMNWISAGSRIARLAFSGRACAARPLSEHRDAELDWLCRAQDATPDAGVSAGYHLKDGWLASYPETTGYIACTFFDAAARCERDDLAARAARMIDWLLGVQFAQGGFPGQFGERSRGPIVFNTGQILFGLLRAFDADPSRDDIATAAKRAANWLCETIDDDGCWRVCTHNNVPHSYNARTAWALLRFSRTFDEGRAEQAALRNLHWTLACRNPDGWFDHMSFRGGEPPFLHTIAYTLRGLLESGLLLCDDSLIDAAYRPARALAESLRANGAPAGAYRPGFAPCGRFRCLTGEAQMAVIWLKLWQQRPEPVFLDAARRAVRLVADTQSWTPPAGACGAIAGSQPIWGGYARFEYPNWAAKFFIDAVLELQSEEAR